MSSNPFKEICQCPGVCQLVTYLNKKGEAWGKEIVEIGISRTTVNRLMHRAEKYGLIEFRFDVSTGKIRKYFFLSEKGKRQAEIIKQCNDHLLSK